MSVYKNTQGDDKTMNEIEELKKQKMMKMISAGHCPICVLVYVEGVPGSMKVGYMCPMCDNCLCW